MAGEPDSAASQTVDALGRQVAALARENARLAGELQQRTDDLRQSREYQAAIGEVLAAISRSTIDLAPILQTLADTALRLCEAEMGFIVRRDGEAFIVVTAAGATPEIAADAEDYRRYQSVRPIAVDRGSVTGRVALAGQPVQVPDIAADPEYRLAGATALGKIRTQVGVPLMREGRLVGVLILSRQRVEPFSERQVGLLRTFADQAVIAMENARLLGELRESLDQQTATAEVLQVINSSPGDLRPVFEVILEKAHARCGVAYGSLQLYDGEKFRAVAVHGLSESLAKRLGEGYVPGPDFRRLIDGEEFAHYPDMAALADPMAKAVSEAGIGSLLSVALRKDGRLLGQIVAARKEVRPFSDEEIRLLHGFAAQAVIAVENARLLTEQRDALEQQTATAEVLQVINASPGDLAPVFDAMLEKATRLCGVPRGKLALFDGNLFRFVAVHGDPQFVRNQPRDPRPPSWGVTWPRLVAGEDVVHMADVAESELYRSGHESTRRFVEVGGGRSLLTVALRKDSRLLGALTVYSGQVQPFSDKQIALLRSFAAQAVIAMENARLLDELRESLDQQTATSDVLRTISRSSVDLGSVLETLVATVARLCRGDQAWLFRRDGNLHHLIASAGASAAERDYMASHPFEASRGNTSGRVVLERRTIHIPDVLTDPEYTWDGLSAVAFRTTLGIPLLREDTLVGVFVVCRTQVAPFSDKEIELASGFADQAMIAIENARLFEELSDRQAELRVTLDNTGDGVVMFDADFRLASWNRNFQEMLDIPDDFVAGRPAYDDYLRLLVGRGELGDGDPEGIVASHRQRATRQWSTERTRPDGRIIEVRNNPVPDGGAVLIYADITERKRAEAEIATARDAAEEALEQQTATADILKVIASSPTDLQPVLDAVVKAAVRFCGATDAVIILREGEGAFFAAHEGPMTTVLGSSLPLNRETSPGRAILDGRTCHLPDIASLDPVEFAGAHRIAAAHGFRAALAAPLLRQDTAIGSVTLRKAEAGPFTPRQIELLETFAAQAVIAIENVRLFNDLRESLAQQTATAEILRVISQSPTDVKPVLTAVAKAAMRFCGAADAAVALREGDCWVAAAHEGTVGHIYGRRTPLDRQHATGRSILDGVTCHLPHVTTLDPAEWPSVRRMAAEYGFDAVVAAPLLRDGVAIGAVVLRKVDPAPFTPPQIAMLETFAAQAVIAIENVRLFTELSDALEQQTATADILNVIAGSPTDVQPVLDAVAKAAVRFCGATDAMIQLRDGDSHVPRAHEGPLTYSAGDRRLLDRSSVGARATLEGRTFHFPDVEALDPVEFATTHKLARQHGFRAFVVAPLMREDTAIGTIVLRKVEPSAFTPQQIQLLETFAAQAVIAIENVRLFNDLRDALEQQTATADILKVIASSPTAVQPVLDAVARAAVRFCGAPDAMISLRDGDERVAIAHEGPLRFAAARFPLERGAAPARAILDARTIHLPDIEALDPAEFGATRAVAARNGFRASLNAPLLRDGIAIGAVSLRKPEPGSFTPRQMQLLETFAAQAVIAIENVRLFTELKESLEQQTATADILGVISRSPTDVQPVLEAVTRAALRFCGAPDALVLMRDGDDNVVAAHQGTIGATLGLRRPITANFSGQALLEGRTLQIADVDELDSARYAGVKALARENGWRASTATPMMHAGKAIGLVVLRKPEPGLLSPRQIALLETFAAQAVIAIENVRLFTELGTRNKELSEALEQQTATAEILRVISQSPTDVQPVLEAVTRAALRFCGAPDAIVWLRDGDDNVVAAHQGVLTATLGLRSPVAGSQFSGLAMLEGRTRQIADVDALDAASHAGILVLARQHKWRSATAAPMMHGGKAIGCVVLRKPEPGLLSPRQIALLETFAAQAVIAIENVRLFTELKESLEQQTATADILKVIASSPTDVQPVLEAVARAAVRFCGAPDAIVQLREGNDVVVAAHEGPLRAKMGQRRPIEGDATFSAVLVDGRTIHYPDVQALDAAEFATWREVSAEAGWRAFATTPLLREGTPIGCISLRRVLPGSFTPQQIELLKTFAAQAVIAIENVRLFTELRETLDQQTASAEILRVISQSPTDVQPVLDAIAESAVRLCAGEICAVYQFDGTLQHLAAHYRVAPEVLARLRQRYPQEPDRNTVTGRAILERTIIHVSDIVDDPRFPGSQKITAGGGYRAVLAVPMMQDEQPIGVIFVVRLETTPFSDKQIELLRTFAAQAVIAIQNVRLFTELRDSLERLKAAQANLIQSEKMASLGQLTAGIAHEIKNPLNFVNNFAALSVELLDELKETADAAFATLDADTQAEVDETMALLVGNLGKIAEHGKRADGIVRSMLSHSRGGSGDWAPSDINALVEEALNLAYHGARAQDNEFNVTLERDLEKSARPIEVVPQDVTRVFLNLLGNGFYAVGKRGREDRRAGFRPTLRVSTRDLGEAVEVRVRDNGTGIPPDVRAKLFQPFFTTKPTGEGTGLGLSISYDIVTQQHGGSIEVESEPGSFTEFTVRLPRRRVQSGEGG